jgi:hypothetical protein
MASRHGGNTVRCGVCNGGQVNCLMCQSALSPHAIYIAVCENVWTKELTKFWACFFASKRYIKFIFDRPCVGHRPQ